MNDADRSDTTGWRQVNHLTDWEFAEVGVLLCDHEPRDLALMVLRLRAQLQVCEQLRKVSSTP